eukprot:SAG22_NODE_16_length_32723_cov_26.404825_6_plen_84_part_00
MPQLDSMLTAVPNFLFITGYFQASWTLKADLLAAFCCRIVNRLLELGESLARRQPAAAKTDRLRRLLLCSLSHCAERARTAAD